MTDPQHMQRLLQRMFTIRAFEERVAELYGAGYGIPPCVVDGMDVLAVEAGAAEGEG